MLSCRVEFQSAYTLYNSLDVKEFPARGERHVRGLGGEQRDGCLGVWMASRMCGCHLCLGITFPGMGAWACLWGGDGAWGEAPIRYSHFPGISIWGVFGLLVYEMTWWIFFFFFWGGGGGGGSRSAPGFYLIRYLHLFTYKQAISVPFLRI